MFKTIQFIIYCHYLFILFSSIILQELLVQFVHNKIIYPATGYIPGSKNESKASKDYTISLLRMLNDDISQAKMRGVVSQFYMSCIHFRLNE